MFNFCCNLIGGEGHKVGHVGNLEGSDWWRRNITVCLVVMRGGNDVIGGPRFDARVVIGGEGKKSRPCWIFLASDWWRQNSDVTPEVKKGENG